MSTMSTALHRGWLGRSGTASSHRPRGARLSNARKIASIVRWARAGHTTTLAFVVAIGLAAPALLALVSAADISGRQGAVIGVGFSIVELPLLMFAMHHLLLERERAPLLAIGSTTEDLSAASNYEPTPRSHEERLHELRATVAGIAMTHRLLRDESHAVSFDTRERLENLEEAELARLERMVSDGTRRDLIGTRLGPVIDPIVESLQMRGNDIVWSGSDAVAIARADDISEVVHILLQNAVVHAPGASVSVQVVSRGEATLVSVADQGPGVRRGAKDLVFARGFRASDRPGHGLGLHIARRLAREMGGELRLDSTPGGGATFVLELVTTTPEVATCRAH